MRADFLLRQLREKGAIVSLEEGDRLSIDGKYEPRDLELLRAVKNDVVRLLKSKDSTPESVWQDLRRLGPSLGRFVVVDGREVLLWGLSPHGAMIRSGGLILGISSEEVHETH